MRRLVLLLAALAVATPALAFTAQNRFRVVPGPGTDFTVAFRSIAREGDYWCAAGDYVIRGLRLHERTQVYRASPQPRPRGQGVSFTLDAKRAVGTSGLVRNGERQAGMSANAAVQLNCFDFDIDLFGFDRRD